MNICLKIGLATMITTLAAGCGGMGGGQNRHSANLSAYLYSGAPAKPDETQVATLSLPLKLGMAFVPVDGSTNRSFAYASAGPNQVSASTG